MKERDCYNCSFTETKSSEKPCISCNPNTMNKWESFPQTGTKPLDLLIRCVPWLKTLQEICLPEEDLDTLLIEIERVAKS